MLKNIVFQNKTKQKNAKNYFINLNWICPAFINSVDPDQLASKEATLCGSALFVIKNVKLYQQPGSSNLIG